MKEHHGLLHDLSILQKQTLRSVHNDSYSKVNDAVGRYNALAREALSRIDPNLVTLIQPLASHLQNKTQQGEKLHELSDAIKVLCRHLGKKNFSQQPFQEIASFPRPIAFINTIGERFHQVANELCRQANGRPTFVIDKEYAVQGLFHALLKLFFEDIRAEEPVPTQMGASGRIDFFIPREGIGIEIKMIRPGLTGKKLGDELSADIVRYQALNECNNLYCFIYDPKQSIRNPRGFEADAAKKSTQKMTITAVIRPK